MSDARTTIEGSILSAISKTALQTRIVADKGADVLVSEVMNFVFDKSVLWSVEEYVKELREADTLHTHKFNLEEK